MVDLSTAMAAAAASERRRGGRDGEKKTPGGKVGVEPFDPADHVEKEKADTASMWLVIIFGLIISLFMRYVMMPQMSGPASVLWSLPLLLILVLPTMHRLILRKFADRYSFGNWFRGGFLYTFTWLAITFILVNPPMADISPPEIAGDGVLLDIDNPESWQTSGDYIGLEANGSTPDRTGFAFAVRDNADAENVNVTVVLLQDTVEIQRVSGIASEMKGDWDNVSANVSGIASKAFDVPILVEFDQSFQYGSTYRVIVTMTQDAEPWSLEDSETWEFQVGPQVAED